MISKWGKVEPERRHRKDSLTRLFNQTQQEGGVKSLSQYRKFIGEYDIISKYLLKYGYIKKENDYHEDVFDSLSPEIRSSVTKEMIKDRTMVQARDGGYILPEMDILRNYIEAELEAAVVIKGKSQLSKSDEIKSKKKTRFEDESWEEVIKQMKDITKKIKNPPAQEAHVNEAPKEVNPMKDVLDQLKELSEAVNPPKKVWKDKPNTQGSGLAPNAQPFRPRNTQAPLPANYQPYVPAQLYPRPPLKCYYCFENGHSLTRCSYLAEDMEKRIVSRQGLNFLYPNFQRVPSEGTKSPKDLVREFDKEQKEISNRIIEKEKPLSRPEDQKIVELKKEEKEVSIAQVEDWGNWEPPIVSSPTEMLETHATLRQTKQRLAKQESQNREDSQSKKPILPGTYHEDEAEEEMKIIVPTKYKDKHTKRDEKFEGTESKEKENVEEESDKLNKKMVYHKTENKEVLKDKKELKPKLAIENVIKKILEQKINLTLKEILSVSPAFIHRLQGISLKEKETLKSVNTLEIEEDFIYIRIKDFEKPRLNYSCPLGFMQLFVGKEEYPVMALRDTGSELNIITEDAAIKATLPNRKLNMNLREIGGHTTSLIGLAEFTQVLLPSGEEKEMHFFISKGEVHTVLGRPFLAENNIRLDPTQKQGEIFSYQEADGRRLCMPICKPHMLGWQTGAPRGMELFSMGKIRDWFSKVQLKEA
ncbi:hypothetical protein O181_109436 [Austropuccinia psidii MF-1]|uniref:Peptidase A2 domain-containing protein n=1 Tax=Austropuccinia psidii MF-1 TaxID=1389203 RepID=A0A9Q3PQW7_9BASI|nr:hypothetical protein [Austropuccinia psidii MF-1]